MFDFDDLFNLAFNNFNRPVKDMKPYSVYSTDCGYIIVANTLGIDKDDLNVEISKEKGKPYPFLKITGETNIEKINFKNKINLKIQLMFDDDVSELRYEVKNGLTMVYLKTQADESNSVMKATYTDDDFKF